jgi:hypothetical protein
MGSGAMIYIPNLVEIGSGIMKLRVGDSQTHSMEITLAWFRKVE